MSNPQTQFDVTVVALTFNRSQMLQEMLEAIASQDFPAGRFRAIIVDNGSNDGGRTQQILREFRDRNSDWFDYIQNEKNCGLSFSRNRAIHAADTDLIAFTDDDCAPRSDWLSEFVAYMNENPDAAGAGGIVRGKRKNIISRFLDAAKVLDPAPAANGEAAYLITANACYRRETLLRVGGFDESFVLPGGEDADLSERIKADGGRLHVCENAVVFHDHRDTLGGFAQTFVGYGKGAAQMGGERRGLQRLVILPFVSNAKLAAKEGRSIFERVAFGLLGCIRILSFIVGYRSGRKSQKGSGG